MDRKKLQELIKSIIKEANVGGGATSGFTTGVGYQHQGKKPKDESKNYQKVPKDGKGVPTVFTKGANDLSAYKSIGYREVKPSEMIDAAYLWAGKGGLNEGRYSQFKRQTEIVKPSNQINIALKEVFKRLKEVNKVASYTKQLKNELSESNDIAYTKRSEAIISKLMQETASLYKNLKEIKNGKSKN